MMYGGVKENCETKSDSKCTDDQVSEPESEGSDDDDSVEGHRIIDISILSDNIAEQLRCAFCAFCGSDVVLMEVDRVGLGSRFALAGKGRLTDWQIDRIQRMYGNAIRRNKNNLTKMREHVWAIYWHKQSTDKEPHHKLCPEKCTYKTAERDNKLADYKHTSSLPKYVMEMIKPVFTDLSASALLTRCLGGYTQNPNESLNSQIWKYCPKKKAHGIDTVEAAVAIAVGVFNDGSRTFGDILSQLNLTVGKFARACFSAKDTRRIKRAQKEAQESSHEARIARRQERLKKNEASVEAEGFPYQSGAY
ncbi:hypothetical protein V1264_011038 [Littorina saxatilis]|uniref:Uncharacterized protein n=1 Tax=Littorina saxatilis TaxID=31220 RepID=A0AAN9BRW4_9CAEN